MKRPVFDSLEIDFADACDEAVTVKSDTLGLLEKNQTQNLTLNYLHYLLLFAISVRVTTTHGYILDTFYSQDAHVTL